jgi:DNA-nicking Smr family endonuclease
MTKPPPNPKSLATDAAWLAEIANVRKQGEKAPNTPPTPKIPPATGPDTVTPQHRISSWHTKPPFPVQENTSQRQAGADPSIDSKILKHLAKGQYRPTAVVDLHGLGEGDAWLELMEFLHEASRQSHRVALVIHGKGRGWGPQGDMGVIKYQCPAWLAGHPKVLAFHTALPTDGGIGATYVYLRI